MVTEEGTDTIAKADSVDVAEKEESVINATNIMASNLDHEEAGDMGAKV